MILDNIKVVSYENANIGILSAEVCDAVISNCYVKNSTVTAKSTSNDNAYIGGLVGQTTRSEVKYCFVENIRILNQGETKAECGGLIGNAAECSVRKCFVISCIIPKPSILHAQSDYPSGLVGRTNSTIQNCDVRSSK